MKTDRRYHFGQELEMSCKILGVDFDRVLEKTGIKPDDIGMKHLMMTAEQVAHSVSAISSEYGRDDMHIKLTDGYLLNPVGISNLAFISSATVKDGIERIVKIKPTTFPALFKSTLSSAGLKVSMHKGHSDFFFDGFLEIIMYRWLALCIRKYTLENITPKRLVLSSEIPYQDEIAAELGCPIEISSYNVIEFDAQTIALPLITVNDFLADAVDQETIHRIDKSKADLSLCAMTEQSIRRILPSGNITVERVSNELALSKRTFERRLSQEGVTFRELLEKTRAELSLNYLSNQDYSLSETSFMLGFNEPNSFFRAFKKWHGSTPLQIRASFVKTTEQ